MKKILCIIALLAVALLVCGCAKQQDEPSGSDTGDATTVPTTPELQEQTPAGEEGTVGTLTQEDLDRLEDELKAMEFEDVGGLSEE